MALGVTRGGVAQLVEPAEYYFGNMMASVRHLGRRFESVPLLYVLIVPTAREGPYVRLMIQSSEGIDLPINAEPAMS